MINNVSNELILWYLKNKRELPWRTTQDPYYIWVSEIILQQTRVAQGLSYYIRFIETFPTIESLARASQDQVLKLWQGLGYYSRARNMHHAAKQIVEKHNGKFPGNYKDLLTLKGIGEYTAAAVASLAFNEPVAVADGNVIRVIARLFALEQPVDKPLIIKEIKALANELLNKEKPALHNQAMMEFGALQCIPANPACESCILNNKCLALKYKLTGVIPVKSQKINIRSRYFYYLVIHSDTGIYFQQRGAGDIWEGLFEFPLIEAKESIQGGLLKSIIEKKINKDEFVIEYISDEKKHILTHQRLHVIFIHIQTKLQDFPENWKTVGREAITALAVPRVIDRYINSEAFMKIMENIG